jgi:hypothetical protein
MKREDLPFASLAADDDYAQRKRKKQTQVAKLTEKMLSRTSAGTSNRDDRTTASRSS